jgi:hypothetical protein
MPVANFLTALAATFIFKVALFAYSTSGAEGAESALEALSRRWQDHSRYLIENYAAVLGSSGRRCVALPSPRGME